MDAGRSVVVTVNRLLGIEDQALAEAEAIQPVPATSAPDPGTVFQPESRSGTNQFGRAYHTPTGNPAVCHLLSLDHHPLGIYILRIRMGDKTASKRVVKL